MTKGSQRDWRWLQMRGVSQFRAQEMQQQDSLQKVEVCYANIRKKRVDHG
jgi:hypothetical protein